MRIKTGYVSFKMHLFVWLSEVFDNLSFLNIPNSKSYVCYVSTKVIIESSDKRVSKNVKLLITVCN